MKSLRALKYIAAGLALAYAFPAACGSGGVVGGECAEGYDCSNGPASGGNVGTGARGGASNRGGDGANVGGDGAAAASQGGETGELPDGGFFDSPVDGQNDAEAPVECLPPHDAPSHCGDCDTVCREPTPLCAPSGPDEFECVPRCEPPLVECQGQCVDPASFKNDPDNCGKCGNECASDICQDGMCVGAKYGSVSLICMDFGSNMSTSYATTLLGNAIFMPAKNPVRVLAYTRGTSAAAVTRTNNVIGWAGDARGRTAEISVARSPGEVVDQLSVNAFDVLLIHDLDRANPGEPRAVAEGWESSNVLTSFTKAGGMVVVLNGGDGTGEMHEFINAGRLLDPSGQTSVMGQFPITGAPVFNQAPGDVLGANTTDTFAGPSRTCTFDTDAQMSSSVVFVFTDDSEPGEGDPVVIHRIVAP